MSDVTTSGNSGLSHFQSQEEFMDNNGTLPYGEPMGPTDAHEDTQAGEPGAEINTTVDSHRNNG